MLLSAVVIAALVWYIMTPAERERAVRASARAVARVLPWAKTVVKVFRRDRDELLEQMLRQRTPWPIVTLLIAALNVGLYVWMRADASVPLVDSLSNFAPRTANGEWWRLVTAAFLHANLFLLVLNVTAVVQVGLMLERLVGSLTFMAVYLVAAVFANLAALSASQVDTTMGASGGVFGIYGLLIATWMWGTLQHSDSTMRLRTVKAFAPVAALCAILNLVTDGLPVRAECLGLVTGFTCGVLLGRSFRVSKPPVRRVASIAAAGAYLAIVAAVPLRGVSDPRPVLASVVAVEQRTMQAYDAALDDFRSGRIDQKGLALVIDRQVLPQLQFARFELQRIGRAPREHLPLIQAAEIYTLRRIESWKIRSRALRDGNSRQLRNAEDIERVALDRLRKIQLGP
jgi:rhomboid protease GluP